MKSGALLQILQRLSRHSDWVMASGAIVIIALMVLPLPLAIIDTLIALNFAAAIALLTYAMYVPSPLALSTFPALVLMSTLFRVALDIAITRPILLHGNGGDIIVTFGKLVVGGNVIVGLVIFAIITIVQFIVIAKGAERVAEVSARFTLDAMPGRQLSIDADLRSGIINEDEARQRRREIADESQLHGAMDGAMKFIKGDVIAGICIVLINLIGGITVGVVLRSMEFSEALQKYSVLSVGQGLVSQIPSLFVALSAGLLVTRTGSGEADHLGEQIYREVQAQPKALYVTGLVTLLFVLVPGFPKVAFIFTGALLAGSGYLLYRDWQKKQRDDGGTVPMLARQGSRASSPMFASDESQSFAPVTLEIGSAVAAQLSASTLNEGLKLMRRQLFKELGAPFPGLKLFKSDTSDPNTYALHLFDEPIFVKEIDPKLDAQATMKALITDVESALRKNAARLLGVQDAQALLVACKSDYPDLVQLAQQNVPLPRLSETLRQLLAEGVPIRNLRDILECLIEHAPKEKDDSALTERCRTALRHTISRRATGNDGLIHALLIDPNTEESIRKAIKPTPSGPLIALPSDQLRALATQAKTASAEILGEGKPPPVLLVSPDVRRAIRRLLELPVPEVQVISYAELSPESQVATERTLSL